MIRLVAIDQGTNAQTTLDLEGSPSISLNLAVAKPGETMQRHAPYSQTFRMPFSQKNNIFFSHFYEVTLSDGDFNPTLQTDVLLYEDGVQVIRGTMQLRAVRLMAEVYEVNVLGDTGDLFAATSSKLLQAAFLDGNSYTTDLNFDLTAANVLLSQDLGEDITNGSVGDGVVVVPFADHGLSLSGQPIVAQNGVGMGTASADSYSLYPDMLKPAIQLRELVDRIITSAGFYYDSNFFDSAFFGSIYMTLGSEVERVTTGNFGQCLVFPSSDVSLSPTPPLFVVPYDSLTTLGAVGFDPDERFSLNSSTYIAGQGGLHKFSASVRLNIEFTGGDADSTVGFVLMLVAGGQVLSSQEFTAGVTSQSIPLPANPPHVAIHTIVGEGNLAANTGVQVLFAFTGTVPTLTGSLTAAGSRFRCTQAPGGEVDIPKLLPRIKQKDLLRDLCQRFNLVIEASPDDPKRLYIEPYEDWINDGADIYWTDKLDMDKERTLMPTSSLKSGRLTFGDKESSDVGNEFKTNRLGRVYGTFDQDIDDAFARGELKNEPVFSPFFVFTVPTLAGDPSTINDQFLIHRSYKINDNSVGFESQPPKLFFAIGNQTAAGTYYLDTTSFNDYLFCSPFNEAPVDSNTQSLVWNSSDLPFMYTSQNLNGEEGVPAQGLHQSYWASYLADIYDADARVFEAHLYLTPSDVRNVRFNDRFHILGATYKLTEISGYQIGTGESVLCKFLRDLGRSSFGACQNVPSTSNTNGTVTFVDPAGNNVTDPGQQCCEAFGYYYDASSGACYWQAPGDDVADPAPPFPSDGVGPVPFTNPSNGFGGPIGGGGEGSLSTDSTSGTAALLDKFVLVAESVDATATDTTIANGAVIQVDSDTIATGTVKVATATVGGTSGTAFESSFETWRFLANGRAETVTFTKTSGTTLTSGSPGTRNPSATISGGVLSFQVTGLSNTIINWTLEVDMVRMQARNEQEYEDAILTEGGSRLAGINDRVILQE